jgi:hypothetical protein
MNISLDELRSGLSTIGKDFRKILAPNASSILEEASIELTNSKFRYDEKKKRKALTNLDSWGILIHKEKPLRFIESNEITGAKLFVDLYCNIQWREDNHPPTAQDICLRIWSSKADLIFRERWDSKWIMEKLTQPSQRKSERVMHRMHFDKANHGQKGPAYHLQFGGNQAGEEVELCWFPELVKLPRLIHPPMDLILTCQFIAANFYGETYKSIKETPYWGSLVRKSQKHLLEKYYHACLTTIQNDGILLDTLWN